MKKIIILTGSELRHRFVRTVLSNHSGIRVLRSYCEDEQGSLAERLQGSSASRAIQIHHEKSRNLSEEDFFRIACKLAKDNSNPVTIRKGGINDPSVVNDIVELKPDLLCCYGSSLIKSDLIEQFKGRFLNLHLGLSPYYRGSGTNYFPLVNREPEYVGATFMHLDQGIDTGKIIHQIQARINCGDNIHQIGNRLICDAGQVYAEVISRFDNLVPLPQPVISGGELYLRKDFTPESLAELNKNFKTGMIAEYLKDLKDGSRNVTMCKQKSIPETE